jgi:hypothetical protein
VKTALSILSIASLALSQAPDLHAQVRKAAAMPGATAARPLSTHPQGQAMMAEAAHNAAMLDINFQFLNKWYENDVYAKDPLGNKYRVSCVRFKATSGFRIAVDEPSFTMTTDGLRIEQNFPKLTADGLTVKVQFGPCTDITTGIGVRISDIKVIYTARPMISVADSERCKMTWSLDTDDLRVSIGDLNISGVQNNIDKLAKDAAREALNAAFDSYFGSRMRGELLKVSVKTCGGGKS